MYSTYWKELHLRHTGALSAVGYCGLGEGFNQASYRLRRHALRRLLRRHTELHGASLLEAAVGVGAYAPVWRELGVRSWRGVDISPEAVRVCQNRFPHGAFEVQDITDRNWAGKLAAAGGLDLVTAIDVLYHLVDDESFAAALDNLRLCLRPGGSLIVSDTFPPCDQRIAAHVKRRSMAAYQRIFGGSMRLADREPVFAILGDPVPRPGRRLDWLLSAAWKAMALTLLHTPGRLRDPMGKAVVFAAWPFDGLLRALGLSRGVNLELALFTKN
ncbi:MAG: class I SAM-dependent methyltransferase [Bryobacteraceae bacterium]|nr:class I SAM-dependent methyltransferase [Bryobacteraceae bacterium]